MRFAEFVTEDEILNESFWNWMAQKLMSNNQAQNIPGNTPEEKLNTAVDSLQLALDLGGVADPTGIADGANGVIYLLRAAADNQNWPSHVTNALISFVSIIPFADVVKLAKVKGGTKLAKNVAKGSRAVKTAGQNAKLNRQTGQMANTYNQFGPGGVQAVQNAGNYIGGLAGNQ